MLVSVVVVCGLLGVEMCATLLFVRLWVVGAFT